MNIVVLTDIHGETSKLHLLKEELSKADIILLVGDITHFGRIRDIKKIVDILQNYNTNFLAIPGNCDYPEVSKYLIDENISLHCRSKEIHDIVFIGAGGSLPCPGSTPLEFSDEELYQFLHMGYKDAPKDKTIVIVCHQPPVNTVNDSINGIHVGSIGVRKFIEEVQPVVCFCGHIHEGIGEDIIGSTKIVNSGPFRYGKYTLAQIQNGNVTLEIKSL